MCKKCQNYAFGVKIRRLARCQKFIHTRGRCRKNNKNRNQQLDFQLKPTVETSKQRCKASSAKKPLPKTSLFRKHNIFTRIRHRQHQEYMLSSTNNMSLVPMLHPLDPKDIERLTNADLPGKSNKTLGDGPEQVISKE